MRIKTYTSDSVPKALEQIKKELGPGAIILNTKRTTRRRLLGLVPSLSYEITAAADTGVDKTSVRALDQLAEKKASAALEPADSPAEPIETYEVATTPPAPAPKRFPVARSKWSSQEDSAVPSQASIQIPEMEALRKEIAELKRAVASQSALLSPSVLFLRNDLLSEHFQKLIWQGSEGSFDWKRVAAVSEAFKQLAGHGVDESLSFALLREVAQHLPAGDEARTGIRQGLNQAIAARIGTRPLLPPEPGVRAAIFLGPTGVGKTTTVAKLAAHLALREEKRIQLVSLDTYRIGAAEQLKTYGDIIGVPVRIVFSVEELQEAVASPECEYSLIDTTGHSHKKVADFAELAELLSRCGEVEKHLVLSATTKPEDLRQAIESFQVFGIQRLVFTKLDESSTYGSILNELVRTGLPLSYLTNGQKVPEDLIVPAPRNVADLLIPVQE